jgi:flagellar motor switch protein FliM
MDADLVNNLVEILTGSVAVSGADAVPRPFTGIDAVLCRQFVNLLMEKFREVLGEALGRDYLGHYSYARYETVAVPLVHVLPRTSWAVFALTLDIGEDGRTGALQLVLPAAIFQAIDEGEIALRAGADQGQEALWRNHMETALSASRMALDTVLERLMLPLGQVTGLRVGDLIDLPGGTLSGITVEMPAPKGPILLARGRLGQFAGRKVVKVTEVMGRPEPAPLSALPAPDAGEIDAAVDGG